MASELFSAVLEKSEDGWGVTFPSFPGCVSWGRDRREAQANAAEALSLHIEGMVEDGVEIPYEGEPDEVVGHASGGTIGKDFWPVFIEVDLPEGSERVNIYLPKRLLANVDSFADQAKMNRSSVFSVAVRRYLQSETPTSLSDREAIIDLGSLAEALVDAGRRAEKLPYTVTFSVERGYQDVLIARGSRTIGMRVNGATTGRLVRDVVANPTEAFDYIFGFLQASLDPKEPSVLQHARS